MATKFTQVELDKSNPRRKLGFGAPQIKRGMKAGDPALTRFVGAMRDGMRSPSYNLPVIESVRIHYGGPLTDTAISGSFGAYLDPLGANPTSPPAGALSVESTMVEPGKVQTWNLVCAIGWQLEPEPMEFTAKCNAFTAPQTAVAKPVSPDFFTENDLNNFAGGFNSLGMTSGQTMVPAELEWGWWAGQAMYYMVRAYNLEWQVGNRTFLLNDSLRYTAYVPSNAQDGSASSSEVDLPFFVRRVNDYYREELETNLICLMIDRARVGSVGGPALDTTNTGIFRPTRAYETVGATYGGLGVRSLLRGNTEFRKMSSPYLLRPGVPIGLRAHVSNGDDQALMQQYLSATNGFKGLIPAIFSEDGEILAGSPIAGTGTGSIVGSAITGDELTLDPAGAISVPQQVPTGRVEFKGGAFKITVALKGFELDEATKDALTDPDVMAVVNAECGGALAPAA
jgi:hypothetical protein